MILICSASNDLYRVLLDCGYPCDRYDDPDKGLQAAPKGSAVLILADTYPAPGPAMGEAQMQLAHDKGLRLYVEYPSALPGIVLGEPRAAEWERVVVASDWFAPGLERGAIIALHGCWYRPVLANGACLALARVAGYRHAVYGLPDETYPILFQLPGQDVLVATSKLSGFVTGRYGPRPAWAALWQRILAWLEPQGAPYALRWEPTVGVQAGPAEALPDRAEEEALRRSARWFREQAVYSIDAKKGVIEGFEAGVDHEGRQRRRTWPRGDCIGESALVFALDGARTGNPASARLAGQMLDYVWSTPDFRQADPASPAYGLNNWYERGPVFYGDDNARVILPTLAAGKLLGDSRWDESVLRCLAANLRTTGPLGFRHGSLRYPESFAEGRGWQFYFNEPVIEYAPHYQAYLWAAFLWAHALTGYEGFLERPRTALRMCMDVYPKWRWTNGLTQELARMLLPLAYLVRVDDTAEHRQWLARVAGDLLAHMQPCGAIREHLGPIENGAYPPPRSNEAYGKAEASCIQENGDPACDLLYTTNYAFLGLHEAAAATGDPALRQAEDRLAEFLCRIQVRSAAQPYLDGAWMRSFDYDLWEYWGSSADLGWGAWCIETGWMNAWIASVIALRLRGETLWDTSTGERLRRRWPQVLKEMLPS